MGIQGLPGLRTLDKVEPAPLAHPMFAPEGNHTLGMVHDPSLHPLCCAHLDFQTQYSLAYPSDGLLEARGTSGCGTTSAPRQGHGADEVLLELWNTISN